MGISISLSANGSEFLQLISSLNIMPSSSLLTTLHRKQTADENPVLDSFASKNLISLPRLSFIWGIIPKVFFLNF